ncbi:signal peptidase II [Pontibacter sp. G13]|uniref:signal peptidase II n=1 Tax=Pontibacter sp. G13 TaxID=3074898 RepID=UPI00288B94A8|nr:signal peptidase II [Pontibacter sp. G13]WNJ21429.1 signal peptidase II [Pontibacter sp. G13]
MLRFLGKAQLYFLFACAVALVDQGLKIMVKLRMDLYEEVQIFGNHVKFYFTENNGFAFGLELFQLLEEIGIYMTPHTSKTILSLFSLIAVILLGLVLYRFSDHRSRLPWFIALIFGGALGNIIDRMFYGMFFQSINQYAGGFLHGRVVDMIFLDFGGAYYLTPVFNLADVAITFGLIIVLIFQGVFMRRHERKLAMEYADQIALQHSST